MPGQLGEKKGEQLHWSLTPKEQDDERNELLPEIESDLNEREEE